MTQTRTAASLVRDFFLVPAGAARAERVAPVAPVVVVLGGPRAAAPVACAVALDVARRSGFGHAAVCLWPPSCVPATRAPGSGAARREASRAAARGCVAEATGRLMRARLPESPSEAVAAAQRVVGSARCPVAIAIAGPRTEPLDTLLALADAIVVARGPRDDPSLVEIAAARLSDGAVAVTVCEGRFGAFARLLVTSGLAVTRAGRTATAQLDEAEPSHLAGTGGHAGGRVVAPRAAGSLAGDEISG